MAKVIFVMPVFAAIYYAKNASSEVATYLTW